MNQRNRIFFLFIVLLNTVHLFIVSYPVSMDGAQHAYTASLIIHLLGGNETISQFVAWNDILVGNCSGQYILALLTILFPAHIAGKLLLFILFAGLAGSFFFLVVSIKGRLNYSALVILPFTNLALINLGFYNFGLGLILYFCAMGYWIKYQDTMSVRHWLTFGLLVFLIYFSHLFVFLFFVFSFGVYVLYQLVEIIGKGKAGLKVLKPFATKIILAICVTLPTFYFAILYATRIWELGGETVTHTLLTAGLISRLLEIRPLIAFHIGAESYITKGLLALLIISSVVAFVYRITGKMKSYNNPSGFWFMLTILLLVLYIILPEGTLVAGNVSLRLGTFFFLSFIVWLALQDYPSWYKPLFILLILALTIAHRMVQHPFRKELSNTVEELMELESHIAPNSSIFSYKCTEHWFDKHFPLYLGAEKPLAIINNTQFGGLFPLVWNDKDFPNFLFGNQQATDGIWWRQGPAAGQAQSFDFVLIWGGLEFLTNPAFEKAKQSIDKYYSRIQTSSSSKAMLYSLRHEYRE